MAPGLKTFRCEPQRIQTRIPSDSLLEPQRQTALFARGCSCFRIGGTESFPSGADGQRVPARRRIRMEAPEFPHG